ncbi:MAG: hypothetical protein FWD75_02145 [Propionibacteriaceae bacterium]|nr:hypothetical protein [Propionibacteriaceae bacterium]
MSHNDDVSRADVPSRGKPGLGVGHVDPFGLIAADLEQWQTHFGVNTDQTSGYPRHWSMPAHQPTEQTWHDALDHQCVVQVTAAEAYTTVFENWRAVVEAQGSEF